MYKKASALLKQGYSLTDEGHNFDETSNLAKANFHNSMVQSRKRLGVEKARAGRTDFSSESSPLTQWGEEVMRNKAMKLATKHAAKENSYNPLTGWSDKSYAENREKYENIKKAER